MPISHKPVRRSKKSRARGEPPTPTMIDDIARMRVEVHDTWEPRALARLAGLDLAVGLDDGSEHTTADCLIYRWHADRRVRDERVLREMARALLLRHRLPGGDRDALTLAIALCGYVAPLDLRPGLEARLHARAA